MSDAVCLEPTDRFAQAEKIECIHLQPQHLFAINKGYSIKSASFNHRQAKGQSETLQILV
ncbi:hypothetical protein RO3G_05809 [Rhizopus delemar RA 99-880]|uniref:Uncharacterized protein n=1 Tax=Rhizopus delemar (strain RA 99-880 / ATCC MYA-4621 / FGSC 9543 / NRRL 43880) TaxID=246409 RepID=I1BY24_RHIO9|nr:hypothetical protein RO3G_05809 [Rhizopus delemar RA 99-880]|eukprot:EIE81104.1 hypothetical protein RO3G_05809 [Rhizopus delemar RA 99-880]